MNDIINYLWNKIKKENIQSFLIINNNLKYKSILLIAKYLLCKNKNKNCIFIDTCTSCKIFKYKKHPDYHALISKNQAILKIKATKITLNKITYQATISKNKIIIINKINNMNKEAEASLLKILENPFKNTIFLIFSNNLNINQAISERCYTIETKKPHYYSNKTSKLIMNNCINNIDKEEQLNFLYIFLYKMIKKEKNKLKINILLNLIDILLHFKLELKLNKSLDISVLLAYINAEILS